MKTLSSIEMVEIEGGGKLKLVIHLAEAFLEGLAGGALYGWFKKN